MLRSILGKFKIGHLKPHSILILCIFLLVIFKLPSLFEPTWYGDEGIYATVGNEMNRGELLYKDTWDNKTPLIYYTYGLVIKLFGVNQFYFRFLALIAALIALIYFYKAFKNIFVNTNFLIPGILFILFTSTPIIEGNIANAENFFLPFSMIGLYYGIKYTKSQKTLDLILIGLAFGIGFLYKTVPVFEFAAVFLFIFLNKFKGVSLKQIFSLKNIFSKETIYPILAFVLPSCLFLLLFLIQGNLPDFIHMLSTQGSGYAIKSEISSIGFVVIKDFFIEYPPLSAFFIGFPIYFISGLSMGKFLVLYVGTVGIWIIAYFIIIYKSLIKFNVSKEKIVFSLLIVFLCILILYNLVFARYDIIPAILSTFGVLSYIYYLKSNKSKYLIFTAIFLALGTSLKIYPIVIIPLIVILEIYKKNYKSLIKSGIVFVLITFISLIFVITGFNNFKAFASFQTKRDIQIESSYASALYVLEITGNINTNFALQNGSIEITNDYSKNLAKIAFPILVISLLFTYGMFILKIRKLGIKKDYIPLIILFSTLAVLSFILFNKVFSPQYIIWLLTFIPIFAIIKAFNKKTFIIFSLLIILICIFTTLEYPIFFGEFMGKQHWALVIVIMRNILLFVLFGFLWVLAIKEIRRLKD